MEAHDGKLHAMNRIKGNINSKLPAPCAICAMHSEAEPSVEPSFVLPLAMTGKSFGHAAWLIRHLLADAKISRFPVQKIESALFVCPGNGLARD